MATHQPRSPDAIRPPPTFWLALGLSTAIFVLLLAGLLVIEFATELSVMNVFDDPVSYGILPLNTGWYTYFGVLVAWTGAVIAIAAAALGKRLRLTEGNGYFLTSGLLLAILALDELLMIHEYVGDKLTAWLGGAVRGEPRPAGSIALPEIVEGVVFLVYALVFVAWLVFARRSIRARPNAGLIVLTLIFFAIAAVADVIPHLGWFTGPNSYNISIYIEELAEIAGFLLLSSYIIVAAKDRVLDQVGQRIPDEDAGYEYASSRGEPD